MKDPIQPEVTGFILDVRRLRALINDPKYHDEMEVYISLSADPDEGTSIPMEDIEFVVVPDEPMNCLVITLSESSKEWSY